VDAFIPTLPCALGRNGWPFSDPRFPVCRPA